ncbi:MAG: DinB family protein, partial [Chloroflexi bacterium]|nr:DinB family protein [Chloroflexota bacterium]
HSVAMTTLRTLSDTELYQSRPTLNSRPVKAWRLLMAMVEHEVHHRSQLAVYLALMGVESPQIYGLGIEDIVVLSNDSK